MTRVLGSSGLGLFYMVLRKEPTYTVMRTLGSLYQVCHLVKKERGEQERWKEIIAEFTNERDAVLFRDACSKATPESGHARYIEGRAEERNEIVGWLRKCVVNRSGFIQDLAKMIENGEHKL